MCVRFGITRERDRNEPTFAFSYASYTGLSQVFDTSNAAINGAGTSCPVNGTLASTQWYMDIAIAGTDVGSVLIQSVPFAAAATNTSGIFGIGIDTSQTLLSGDVLSYNGSSWVPLALPATVGTVTSVTSSNADIGVASGNAAALLTLNSGTGANQIVKLNGSSQLPSVSGANLTNLNGTSITGSPVPITNGGTGQSTPQLAFNALSPMRNVGDVIYGGASGAATVLVGNPTSKKLFLTSTGTGSATNAPTWGPMALSDLPNFTGSSVLATNSSGVVQAVSGSIGNSILQWTVAGVPSWSSSSYPSSVSRGDLLYASGNNVVDRLPAGTDAAVLTMSGGVPTWQASSSTASSSGRQVFLAGSGQMFSPASSSTIYKVTLVGAGGAGCSCSGYGGGAGGSITYVGTLSGTCNISVGAGGAGLSNTGGNQRGGASGGTTSVNGCATLTAYGGNGSTSSSNFSYQVAGGSCSPTTSQGASSSVVCIPGWGSPSDKSGANSAYGTGGAIISGTGSGNPGLGAGAGGGGGGGSVGSCSDSATGGNGADGLMIIEW